MQDKSDEQLLRQYALHGSESAFGEIVDRHADLVYSAGLRQCGSPERAREIAQSVFINLARHGRTLVDKLSPDASLAGWLYRGTRYAALHLLRDERRRQEHERQAMENFTAADETTLDWDRVAPVLDEAMADLGDTDREAVLLRFFQDQDFHAVGRALGVSDDAAQKRVSRAVEHLRRLLAKRGVTVGASGLFGLISTHAVLAAPAGLSATIAATALVPAAAGAITGGAMVAVKTKMIMATLGGVFLIGAGTGAFFLLEPEQVPAASIPSPAAGAFTPIKLANDAFVPGAYMEQMAVVGQKIGATLLGLGANLRHDARFANDTVPDVRRISNSSPAGHIQCLIQPSISATVDYLASTIASNRPLQACRFITYSVATNSPLLGKRIRVSGWLKTKNVEVMAGATLVIISPEGHIFADDPMTDRPLRGTMDWKEIEMVADVPREPCTIYVGPSLYGAGELWADDFQIALAPSEKPITDDRRWHVWSPNPGDYLVNTDFDVRHDGHPSLCISYTPAGPAPAGSWMWWGQCIREPDQYKGQTVRMTVWMRSEGVSEQVYPNLRPKGANFNLLAKYKRESGKVTKGTTGWTKQTFVCQIPEQTQCLDTGFAFRGSGKVWIDMDSLKYEIVAPSTR